MYVVGIRSVAVIVVDTWVLVVGGYQYIYIYIYMGLCLGLGLGGAIYILGIGELVSDLWLYWEPGGGGGGFVNWQSD